MTPLAARTLYDTLQDRGLTDSTLKYATLPLLAGERDKAVSDLMGHESVNFTKDVYTKVLPVTQERASDGRGRLCFDEVRPTLAQPTSDSPM